MLIAGGRFRLIQGRQLGAGDRSTHQETAAGIGVWTGGSAVRKVQSAGQRIKLRYELLVKIQKI